MIGQNMVNQLYDCQVIDPEGEKIGSVKRVWLDGRTGDPVWASVHTGLFGLKETFVPLQRAELHDDRLQVPVGKAQVKDAPRIEAEGDQMSDEEQQTLYRYYGVSPTGTGGDRRGMGRQSRDGQATGRSGTDNRRGTASQPGSVQRSNAGAQQGANQRGGMGQQDDMSQQSTSGRRRAGMGDSGRAGADQIPAGEGMTRSEERLQVGTEQVETGRVRLVKHVVTEEQQVSVPVSHEEVRIEREPVTDAGSSRAEIAEGEQEVLLHAEKPVVRKETVPMERVRLAKDTVTEQETVSGEVRKEQIDIENDQAGRHGHKQPPAR